MNYNQSRESVFEVLQREVDLASLVRQFTALKRIGKSLRGRCPLPNHKDTNPSFFVYPDNRVHCFGCGFHGDVTDLWAAVNGLQPGIEAALDLARQYGVQLSDRDPEVQKKTEERRQKETTFEQQARACFQALTLHPNVAEWWKRRGFSEELQQQFLLGSNRDGSAALIPFWRRGRIQGLIRRQIEREPKYLLPNADDFPEAYKPLFIIPAGGNGWYIVEGFVDALALAALGFNAVAIGGTGISKKQVAELQKLNGPLFILPDNDERGAQASRQWVNDLYPHARLCSAEYGDDNKDVGDLFAAKGEETKAIIEELKAKAPDALDLAISEAPKGSAREHYLYVREIIFPLLLRIEDDGERNAALEDAARGLKLKISDLRSAFKQVAEADNENQEVTEIQRVEMPEPGSERQRQAMDLLAMPDLLGQAASDMEKLGHVGEERAKKLTLICALSARAGHAIQPSIHAQSSSGKNALCDTVLSLLPPEMIIRRSGLSAKALFRTQANLKGAVLYIQEVSGVEGADYTIRLLQSDGRLEYEATEKTPDGSLRNMVYFTEGPTVIIQTTTRNHLHSENETRIFPIYIDESEEQTQRIVKRMLKEATGQGIKAGERDAILQKWRDAIRLLESLDVVIPFAEQIEMPSSVVRIRRDSRRVIDVVRVIAWLHQYQRERDNEGRIMATEDDFLTALELISDSLARALQVLTPSEQKVLQTIQGLPKEKKTLGFKRRDLNVREVSDSRLKEILKSLVDTGYLDCDSRQGPQGYTYTVARDPEMISLGIFLRPSPDSKQNDEYKGAILDEGQSSTTDQSPNQRTSDESGRKGNRPIKPLDFQQVDRMRTAANGIQREADDTDGLFNHLSVSDFLPSATLDGFRQGIDSGADSEWGEI